MPGITNFWPFTFRNLQLKWIVLGNDVVASELYLLLLVLTAALDECLHLVQQVIIALFLQGFVLVDFLLFVQAMADFNRVWCIDCTLLLRKGSALRGMRLAREHPLFCHNVLFRVLLWGGFMSKVSGFDINVRSEVGGADLILILLSRSQWSLFGDQFDLRSSLISLFEVPLFDLLLSLRFLLLGILYFLVTFDLFLSGNLAISQLED